MLYAKETVTLLRKSDIVIYGARIVAKEVATCLMGEPYYCNIKCFMVTDKSNNPDKLLGLPVIDINEGKKKFQNTLIVIATLEKYIPEIQGILEHNQFTNILPLGFESDLWSDLRGNYIQNLFEKEGKKYLDLETALNDDIHIYTAKCHLDKKICNTELNFDWEIPIQVGAELTDQVICEVRDNVGTNISEKNKEYCELTALYWIWKNDRSKYVGLGHYRRHFDLTLEKLQKIKTSDIDVILTVPIANFPNVRTVYINDHIESDWDTMLEAIKVLQPQYYETADTLQNGTYYYAYNMLIARKEIFDGYCEWLFPILEYIEQHCGRKEDQYQNRYIGFLAERLLSIYFLHNEKRWKIVHARKIFLS